MANMHQSLCVPWRFRYRSVNWVKPAGGAGFMAQVRRAEGGASWKLQARRRRCRNATAPEKVKQERWDKWKIPNLAAVLVGVLPGIWLRRAEFLPWILLKRQTTGLPRRSETIKVWFRFFTHCRRRNNDITLHRSSIHWSNLVAHKWIDWLEFD